MCRAFWPGTVYIFREEASLKSFAKKILAATVAMAILIPMAAISFAAPAVDRIELNIDAITIGVGQKVKTVKPAAYPEGAAAAFTWESADENIAKVNAAGKITGVKKGSTTITIAAGNGVTAVVEVNVVKKGKGVTKIALNKKSASIARGKSVALKAAFTPAKPKNKTVIWKSSDESVATVDNKGKVTGVGTSAFCGCTALKNAVVGDSVEEIGESTFQQTGLVSITIGNSVKSIGDYAFWKCTGLEEIVIPDSVTEIGYAAFEKCTGLKSAEIGNGVENIASNAFLECSSLETVTMGRDVKKIGYYAFQNCTKLTNLALSEELQSIGNCAFKNCTWLSEVVIPRKVTEIGGGAFYNCVRLLKVVIPETVTGITDGAFDLPIGYYSFMEIHGRAGSYAEEYAKRNGIPFIAME